MLASEAEITQRHLALPISEHTPGIRSHLSRKKSTKLVTDKISNGYT